MVRYYVFRDTCQVGSTATRKLAIEMIRQLQARETHPLLRSEFSIICGEEEFISYPKPKRSRSQER